MPERKIADNPTYIIKKCLDPDHEPAKHIVREPGTYEHTCPSCGKMMVFVVPERPTWLTS